ncbi:EI24 domain-containing protein [Cystobacter fuscus]
MGPCALGLVFALLFLVLFVVGASVVVPLVLAPLQDPLSELTEECCGGYSPPPFRLGAFFRGLVLGVSHTLARIFFLLLGLGVLLPLHLVPGVGSIAWAVLGTLWTMLWLAGEHLAAPMTRHQYPFGQVRRVLRQRWPLCLGFGAGVYVLLWVPLLNNFFLPVAVVGGTLLYRGLLAVGNVPLPRTGNNPPGRLSPSEAPAREGVSRRWRSPTLHVGTRLKHRESMIRLARLLPASLFYPIQVLDFIGFSRITPRLTGLTWMNHAAILSPDHRRRRSAGRLGPRWQ